MLFEILNSQNSTKSKNKNRQISIHGFQVGSQKKKRKNV
jgi:hypothetical protein